MAVKEITSYLNRGKLPVLQKFVAFADQSVIDTKTDYILFLSSIHQ